MPVCGRTVTRNLKHTGLDHTFSFLLTLHVHLPTTPLEQDVHHTITRTALYYSYQLSEARVSAL